MLVLEYDGTDFCGWQVQPDERTVQGELNRALSTVLRAEIRVEGAGRTDAGVHALGQVASFEAEGDIGGSIYPVNSVLPDDVVIREARRAPDGFHARFDAVRRHYRYRLVDHPVAVERRTSLRVFPPPNVDRMREAAARLPGHRDFASFASSVEPGESTECILEKVELTPAGEFLNVDVTANRFLRKMVRTLVGTLLEIGWAKRPPEWIDEVLAARNRRAAGPVVAPQGLFLMGVDYPEGSSGTEVER